MTNPAFNKWLHGVLTSKAGAALTDQLFTVRQTGDGCFGWHRDNDDRQHYALITARASRAAFVWVRRSTTQRPPSGWLGVYSHDGWDYSHCEQVVGLDAAIARALEMLRSPHQHFRKWGGQSREG